MPPELPPATPAVVMDDTTHLAPPVIRPRTSSLLSPDSAAVQVQETIVKILLLGDSGVGKSQLFNRIRNNTFNLNAKPTAGIDFSKYTVKISRGRTVKAQIVDLSGLERFRSVTQQYWGLAGGVLAVYDVTSWESFVNVKKWVRDFKAKVASKRPEPVIMIVGTKCDLAASHPTSFSTPASTPKPRRSIHQPHDIPTILETDNEESDDPPISPSARSDSSFQDRREVSTEEAQAFALAQNFLFIETSALTAQNVELAFNILLSEVYHVVSAANGTSPTSASTTAINSPGRSKSVKRDSGKDFRSMSPFSWSRSSSRSTSPAPEEVSPRSAPGSPAGYYDTYDRPRSFDQQILEQAKQIFSFLVSDDDQSPSLSTGPEEERGRSRTRDSWGFWGMGGDPTSPSTNTNKIDISTADDEKPFLIPKRTVYGSLPKVQVVDMEAMASVTAVPPPRERIIDEAIAPPRRHSSLPRSKTVGSGSHRGKRHVSLTRAKTVGSGSHA
ncbi:hypothetical protein HK102_002504 [Quaeritorhiza haematococci]|nr:hypothetical protein HK102_002504 [Quaeritorhiza haematococci]